MIVSTPNSLIDRTSKRLHDPTLSGRAFAVFFLVTILIATMLLVAPKAGAATDTWSGLGGNVDWSTGGNWADTTAPTSSTTTDLIFTGSTNTGTAGTPLNQNIATPMLLNSITFDAAAGSFFLGGSAIAFQTGTSNSITQSSSNSQSIANAITNGFTSGTTDINFTLGGSGSGLVTLSGIISNSSGGRETGIIKTGSSTFLLTGTNTYTFGTTIKAGTILIGNNSALGTSGTVLLGDTSGSSAASLLMNGAFTLSRAITVQSGNTGLMTLGGNTVDASTFSGAITLGTASGTAKSATFVALSGGTATFSGLIAENTSVPNSNVVIGDSTHSGTVKFSNVANTYTGTTTIGNGATLEVTKLANGGTNSSIGNSGSAAAAGSAATDLVIDNGTLKYTGTGDSTNRLFTIGAGGATIDASASANGALSFTGTGSLVASGTGDRVLTLSGTSTGANTLTSVIANPGTGSTSLTKSGTGTWVLTGASTYTGATTINGGILNLNNNSTTTARLAGTSGITVNSGGTLLLSQTGGISTNRINDSAGVTISGGGTFKTGGLSEGTRPSSPSGTDGVAGMGALTLTSTSSGSHATIDFLTGANGSSLVFSNLLGGDGAYLDILNWSGAIRTDSGASGNDRLLFASDPALSEAQLANFQFYNDAGSAFATGATVIVYGNEFELVPVPEPSTWIGGALTLAAIGFTQRRRLLRAISRR